MPLRSLTYDRKIIKPIFYLIRNCCFVERSLTKGGEPKTYEALALHGGEDEGRVEKRRKRHYVIYGRYLII